MADNQITPFQLTDQFTMDNFNQRINETNTALQNKASAGFGFGGETLSTISVSNASESYESFCAKVDAVLATMRDSSVKMILAYPPEMYGYGAPPCILYKGSNDYAGLYSVSSYNEAPFGFRMIKYKIYSSEPAGKWRPFEWVNPPMTIGKEYRTTERYLGKPVYVKAFNTGALGQNAVDDVFVDTPNADNIWVASGTFINTSGGGATPTSIPYHASADDNIVFASAYSGVIHRVYKGSAYTITNMIVVLKYTKSTD